jgi:hypothetical protein
LDGEGHLLPQDHPTGGQDAWRHLVIYDEVIHFVGLPPDQRTDFLRISENKRARLAWLRNFYRKPPPPLRTAVCGLKLTGRLTERS